MWIQLPIQSNNLNLSQLLMKILLTYRIEGDLKDIARWTDEKRREDQIIR